MLQHEDFPAEIILAQMTYSMSFDRSMPAEPLGFARNLMLNSGGFFVSKSQACSAVD